MKKNAQNIIIKKLNGLKHLYINKFCNFFVKNNYILIKNIVIGRFRRVYRGVYYIRISDNHRLLYITISVTELNGGSIS